MAGELDMTLADVIKSKVGKRPRAKAAASKGKAAANALSRSRRGPARGFNPGRFLRSRGGNKAKGSSRGSRPNKRVMSSNLKTKKGPGLVQLPKGFNRFLDNAKAISRKPVDAGGTEAKLGMTLDQIVKTKSNGGTKEKAGSKATDKSGRSSGWKKGVGTRALRRQKLKQEQTGRKKGKGKGGKGSEPISASKGKGKRSRIAYWDAPPPRRQRNARRLAWRESDVPKGKGKGRKGDKGDSMFDWSRRAGKGKRKGGAKGGNDLYDPMRGDDFRGRKGSGKFDRPPPNRRGGEPGRGPKGSGKMNRRREQEPQDVMFDKQAVWGNRSRNDDRDDPLNLWGDSSRSRRVVADDREAPAAKRQRQAASRGSGMMRSAADDDDFSGGRGAASRGGSSRAAESCSIRVSNIPRGLSRADIQEAFGDIGRVHRIELSRGTASITFDRAAAAKKAVQTFDRGELNGQMIHVTFN